MTATDAGNLILNVDDHDANRYVRTRLLKQAGYQVVEAATGGHALEMVASLRPPLVLLDVNLPDMSGFEVCRRIKSESKFGSTFVLQLSASSVTPGDQVGGLDNGADAYLVEPIEFDVLLATIRALLRMRKAEAALAEANIELQGANALLLRRNEDLQRFASAASHDLQEPLRSISNFAGLLEKRYRGRLDANADEILTIIQRGASRMSDLIRSLLVYAQVGEESGTEWGTVNVDEVLAEVLKSLEPSITEAQASIVCEPLPTVPGNAVLLTQLFQNLIQNGLKYHKTHQKPSIHIGQRSPSAKMVEVAICDEGIGIPLEFQRVIFSPFQRLHGDEVPGFGIGLATCQRIVERHHGQIWVESQGEGTGSTFVVSLPLSARSPRVRRSESFETADTPQ